MYVRLVSDLPGVFHVMTRLDPRSYFPAMQVSIWSRQKKLHYLHLLANLSTSMLYLVGLGLADERDITVKGLEVVKRAERVYLEAYTAILLVDVQQLVSCPPHLVTRVGADELVQSRNRTMDGLSLSRTVKWSKARATIF